MRRNGIFWGLVLIVLGGVWLLDNLNLLPVRIWSILWPVLLIAWGGWLLWGYLSRRPVETQTLSVPLAGAAAARLKIGHGAGRLSGGPGAGPDELAAGTCEGGVETRVERAGDELRVELHPPARHFIGGPWGWDRGFDWALRLNPAVPLALELETGAGETRLDLRDLRVTELTVRTGASHTEITLPAQAGFTRVTVEAGAAAVVLHVPEGVAARVVAGAVVGAADIDQRRFPGGRSPDYDTAAQRVEITGRIGAGSLTVR